MGLFCVNMHFRTADHNALSTSLKRREIKQYRLLAPEGGWTTLYEERASQQDEDRVREVTSGLSKDLNVVAIAFLVHDSDIACYWLFENGRLIDEFNSCPDYFGGDDSESDAPSGGQPDLLVKYCKPGIRSETLAEILGEDVVFAEGLIEKLADALGIEPSRALADYRDAAEESDSEDSLDGPPDELSTGKARKLDSISRGLQAQLAGMFGSQSQGPVDPKVAALVDAAVRGNVDEIGRLIGEGADVEGEAPVSPPGANEAAGMGKVLASAMPKMPMTALLAAVVNKRREAAKRLLEAGANPNRMHPLFGATIHAACGAGDPESLQLLLDHGGDANLQNPQKLTPLGVIAAGRTSLERIAQIQEMTKSMGLKLPGIAAQISGFVAPTQGWDACEKLLKERGAR